MNAVNTEDEGQPVDRGGPGRRLKAAREQLDLDLERVAAQLYLSVDILTALEADEYDKLPGAVFIQGYLRSYARMLNLPVEPLLEAFQQNNTLEKPRVLPRFATVKQEVRSNHAVVRIITWLIVVGLLALVVVWWQGYLQWPALVERDSAAPAADLVTEPRFADNEEMPSPLAASLQPEVSALPEEPLPAESEATVTLPSAPMEEAVDEDIAAGAVANEEPLLEPEADPAPETTVADAAAMESAAVAPQATTTVEESEENSTGTTARLESPVEVVFNDACWVDIKDADRSHRVFGVKPVGTRLQLEGAPPYSFVIGNAVAVEVMVNGETFDFSRYTRDNVARFTLDP